MCAALQEPAHLITCSCLKSCAEAKPNNTKWHLVERASVGQALDLHNSMLFAGRLCAQHANAAPLVSPVLPQCSHILA